MIGVTGSNSRAHDADHQDSPEPLPASSRRALHGAHSGMLGRASRTAHSTVTRSGAPIRGKAGTSRRVMRRSGMLNAGAWVTGLGGVRSTAAFHRAAHVGFDNATAEDAGSEPEAKY